MTSFQKVLYRWYEQHKRDLPWRETRDPYKIWISEIILQQTRVNQGLDYYISFLKCFPDIKSLAAADEHEVLKLWQGLGYYSRARNLHFAAKTIVTAYSGVFPSDYNEIIRLKGIGDYTAAAIASISFSKPFPVLDGNVYRLLSRYFNINEPVDSAAGKKYFNSLAESLIDKTDPGFHNQALMEFGALQCIPQNPDCTCCVLNHSCLAFKNDMVEQLPVKSKKLKIRTRYFNYFLFGKESAVFLQKRIENDIWKNLYQLPLIETPGEAAPEKLLSNTGFASLVNNSPVILVNVSKTYKHILTHQVIYARFYSLQVPENFLLSDSYSEVLKKDIHKFAVPRLIEIYLTDIGFLNPAF